MAESPISFAISAPLPSLFYEYKYDFVELLPWLSTQLDPLELGVSQFLPLLARL